MVERRLILHRSNRIEALLDCLVEELAAQPPDPLAAECVVVQSRGMATWLGMRLAEHFGIWAHPDFPLPRRLIERLLRAVLGDQGVSAAFNRELLTLALLELLPRLPAQDEFAPLGRYLAGADDWKHLQLAERIAYLFDQYAVYRPEMVLAWEEESGAPPALKEHVWQPLLWRRLSRQLGSPVQPVRVALDRLRAGKLAAPELLPERLFLFGITTLPPLYLTLLHEAAGIIPVHLLLFSPARDYWADIFSVPVRQKVLLRRAGEPGRGGLPVAEELHLSGGHPLLASLGTVGREFQDILEERTEYLPAPNGERFEAAVSPSSGGPGATGRPPPILSRLQDDILRLQSPAWAEIPAADDRSIVIHSCHSPLREVEVLQDQLLALLAGGRFRPHDVVVMVPDIEAYAPLIEAVFNRPAGDKRRIPYRIADRPLSRQAELIDALFRLFELAPGRLGLSEVLDFLACDPVCRGVGLDAAQLRRIEQWLRQCRVRWGIDEEHRRLHDQPAERLNTWRFGLDRLLLGYALPGCDRRLFAGLLPHDDIEGQDSVTAGRLLAFCEQLFQLTAQVRTPKNLPQWAAVVRRALDDFFGADSGGAAGDWQRQAVREALAALGREGEGAGLGRPLELPAFLRLLRSRLDETGGTHGFLDGGLTFCSMLPMRTIPFPVVCLLGMNDGAFPRREVSTGFDLLAAEPLPGDRSRRWDDRYLFLESLLAARRQLYISYVGRSIRDNRPLPPSVLVDELLDCLAAMIRPEGPEADEREHRQRVVARFVVQHPLQPFSRRYFQADSGPLFTYAAEYLPPAAAPPAPPAPAKSAEADIRLPVVTLAELHRFFRNPAAWYAGRRLGLRLPERETAAADREPLFIEGLDRYRIGSQLLLQPELVAAHRSEAAKAGADSPFYQLLRAAGALPPGRGCWPALADIMAEVEPVAAFLAATPGGQPLPPLELDLVLPGGAVLRGELDRRAQSGLLRYTPGKTSARFFLGCWLDHLALCARAPADQELQTIMAGRDDHATADIRLFRQLEPVTAGHWLQELVELFQTGQQQPLPFFRRSSYEFVDRLPGDRKSLPEEYLRQAREAAYNAFYGTGYSYGLPPDTADPYVAAMFPGHHDPDFNPALELLPGFERVARQVYQPLLDNLKKMR